MNKGAGALSGLAASPGCLRGFGSHKSYYLNSAIFIQDTPFKIALADMIDKFGHAEFGERIAIAAPNFARQVSRLRSDEDIKLESLQFLMNGFGLSLAMSARKMESA
jgi:hypothetical protein